MTQSTDKNPTVTSLLLVEMREAIMDGRYAPGTLLRQETVAEEFGVSRVPVRQVLLALSSEGLVNLQPRRGAVVAGFSEAEIADLFDLRALLETKLLAASLPNLGPDDFAELQDINTAYGNAIAGAEKQRFGELNAKFHLTLYRGTDRPKSMQIVSGLLQSSNHYTRVELIRHDDMMRAHAEHEAVLYHCRSGDIDGAVAALRSHICDVQKGANRYGVSAVTQKDD